MAYEKPIQINPDDKLRRDIERQARAEGRKLGPMTLEIVKRWMRGEVKVAQ